MKAHLGSIVIEVSCEVTDDGEGGTVIADGPPSLSVELDLPVELTRSVPLAIKYLRRVADTLEVQGG